MNREYSLYIDHQLISPLIHQLEDIVSECHNYLSDEYETYQLRIPIYKLFLKLLDETYQRKKDTLKEEKIEESIISGKTTPILTKFGRMAIDTNDFEGDFDDQSPIRSFGKKKANKVGKGSKAAPNLEAEIKLVQWMAYSGRNFFGKKELDDELSQIKGKKSTLTGKRIISLLQKYKLYNITVRNKNGQEFRVEEPKDNSIKQQAQQPEIEIKKEQGIEQIQSCEQSRPNVSPWQRMLGEQSVKEQECQSLCSQSEHEKFDESSHKGLIDMSYQMIFEEESSVGINDE